jgi:myo-inositol-1(or 4)-monophosphatase
MLSFTTSSVSSPGYGYEFSKSYKELFNQDLEMRNSGSIALDLCYLATGRLDGYWAHGIELWDVAAGLLIARESGALISDFNGDPKYLDGDHFICATPKCYKAILKSVKPYFEKY